MARTQVAVIQTPWDCRYSRPGHRITGVTDEQQPEGNWVCTQPTPTGTRHPVTDEDCAACANWVAEDTRPAAFAAPEFSFPDVAAESTRRGFRRSLLVGAGVMMLVIGAGLAGTIVMLPVGAAFVAIGVATVAAGVRDETQALRSES